MVKPVTLTTVALISEALRRGLTISPSVLQQVVDYVLAHDPRMRRQAFGGPAIRASEAGQG